MEERRVTVGQGAGEPDAARDHAAIALAAFAEAEVVVVADGGAGVPPSRAAADSVVRAITRTCQTSATRRPSGLLGEAFGDAHRAVRHLAGPESAASGVGAACVAAVVLGGVATVARAGRMTAFHVRAGVAESVFPETAPADAPDVGPSPLGLGREAPPPIEIEVVPLEPGDRLVLATLSLVRSVDALTLARTAWTLEPQIAANRLVEMARRAGATSAAVQIIRREAPPLADALERLQPARQRQIGRQQDERRGQEQRDRQRRIAIGGFWALAALGVVAIVVAWFVGTKRRQAVVPPVPTAAAPGTADAVGTGPDAAAHDVERAGGRAGPGFATLFPADAGARSAPPLADGGEAVGTRVDDATNAASDGGGSPSADGRAIGDREPPAAEPGAPSDERTSDPDFLALDELFAQRPEDAARDLRRWIVDRYAEVGERAFDTLERYARARHGRHTVAVLVALLDRRPPPKTRAWLKDLLPELIDPAD